MLPLTSVESKITWKLNLTKHNFTLVLFQGRFKTLVIWFSCFYSTINPLLSYWIEYWLALNWKAYANLKIFKIFKILLSFYEMIFLQWPFRYEMLSKNRVARAPLTLQKGSCKATKHDHQIPISHIGLWKSIQLPYVLK